MEDFTDKKKELLSRKRVYQIEDKDSQEIQYLFRDYFGTLKPRAYFVPISLEEEKERKSGDRLLLREETSKLVQSIGDVIEKEGALEGISYDDGTIVYFRTNSQSQPKCTEPNDCSCGGCIRQEKSC